MHEIITDVYTWAWFSEPHGYNFNGYLVRHGDGNLCIDPVQPSDETLVEITRRGSRRFCLTNRNHFARRQCDPLAHRSQGRLSTPPTRHIPGPRARRSMLSWRLARKRAVDGHRGPGEVTGEVALHWPERKPLVVGDVVTGNPPGSCGLLREKVMGRSGPSAAKRACPARARIRHPPGRRRNMHSRGCEAAVAGARRDLPGGVTFEVP